MRVAITGASGFLGSFIVRHLAAAGHQVTALIRPSTRRDHIAPFIDRYVEGDQADESAWPALLKNADSLIHASIARHAWNEDQSDPLNLHLHSNLLSSIKLLRASSPRQFIFISSMAVHHDLNHHRLNLKDDHPLPGSYYAACKSAIEAHVHAEHLGGRATAIIRPCRTYGIDPNLERSEGHSIIESLRRSEPFRQTGWGRWVHVEDVGAAAVAIVGNPATSGRVYDLVDCYARHADWAQMAADVLGIHADIDFSGPPSPGSMIDPDAARTLGIHLNRGHTGIRDHLTGLANIMRT